MKSHSETLDLCCLLGKLGNQNICLSFTGAMLQKFTVFKIPKRTLKNPLQEKCQNN